MSSSYEFLFSLTAPGVSHRLGNSGASHGGMGGRGACGGIISCRLKRNIPYGNLLYPGAFGSGGAGPRGGIGRISSPFVFF